MTVVDLARWAGHKGNTVSMIADRMVNAGLLRRMRDQPDRRLVRLSITKKAEEAFKQGTPALCEYIKQTLAPLTNEDKLTLIRLLTTLREQVLHTGSADPVIPDLETYETRDTTNITTRLRKIPPESARKAERWPAHTGNIRDQEGRRGPPPPT